MSENRATGKIIPSGNVASENTYFNSNKLFVGSFEQKRTIKILSFWLHLKMQ